MSDECTHAIVRFVGDNTGYVVLIDDINRAWKLGFLWVRAQVGETGRCVNLAHAYVIESLPSDG